MKAINLLKNNSVNHLILGYDNLISNPEEEIKKILKILNKEDKFFLFKEFIDTLNIKTRSKKKKIKKIPEDLLPYLSEINNLLS